MADVLTCFPKSMHSAVYANLREASRARTRAAALAAVQILRETHGAKSERGVLSHRSLTGSDGAS